MRNDLIVIVETAVVKIWRIEIGIAQSRRLEQTTRADVVRLVIAEQARRRMAPGTAQACVVRKRLGEQRLAAALGLADRANQSPTGTQAWIGQKIDVLDIGDDGIENFRRRLGPG